MERLQNLEIQGVDIWNPDGVLKNQRVLVEGGVLRSIQPMDQSNPSPSAHPIAAQGMVLMPAGVDPQVHLRVPGQLEKETASSGLMAAMQGGIAALLTMPNTKPVIDQVSVCDQAEAQLAPICQETGMTVLLSAAMTIGERGQESVDFAGLAERGIAAFTDDGVGVVKDELMRQALEASAQYNKPILQHAEFPGHGGVLAPGPVQAQLGVTPYPASAEFEMVARDLELLKQVPQARYHVLHVSSQKTVDLVQEARDQGLRVSCEVTPHHLWFSSHDISEANSSFKMNPPLRGPEDRDFLRQALADGRIDFVATDHAPHEAAIKTDNFKTAAYGTLGLETSLRVLLSLVHRQEISPSRLVEVFAEKPARFLGLDESFGRLTIGQAFRAVLVDDRAERPVTLEDLVGQSKNSCFLGTCLQGEIHLLFIEDRVHTIKPLHT
ncbi:MAG: dihydroorotase [Oligoflexus sp.]